MSYAASSAPNIPYPTLGSTVRGLRYGPADETDFEFGSEIPTESPALFPPANASGHFGSANGLAVINETDNHSPTSHYSLSDFYLDYRPRPQQVSQRQPTLASPITPASPHSVGGVGHLMGFDASSFSIPGRYRSSQEVPSLLASQLKKHSRGSLSHEYQQLTQSPVGYGHGHYTSFSVGKLPNPGLSTTPFSSSQFGGSYGYGAAHANSLLFTNLDWIEQMNKSSLPTPTVSIDSYDELQFDLKVLSPEPTSPMLFDSLDMFDVGWNDGGYIPTSSPLGSNLDGQRMRRRESLRAPGVPLTPNHRTHPYHNRRRSSTPSNNASSSMPSPFTPFDLMMTGTSPMSPYAPSPMFSTSPCPMDTLLRGDSTSRAGSQLPANQESTLNQFSLEQQPAARAIFKYMIDHPKTAIPATYITPELVEIRDGRGKCLIGSCAMDGKLKRVDHLYDHVRDKHFECRPYACDQCQHAFSRDHDLKRHLQIHEAKSLECPICAKSYTRLDNLQRHVQQKHGQVISSQYMSYRRFGVEKPLDPPIMEETRMSRPDLTVADPEKNNASADVLSLQVASETNIGDSPLASFTSRDDETNATNVQRRSLTDAFWPPTLTVVEKPLGSPITEEATTSKSALTMAHLEKKNACTDALSLQEAPTRRNSLETEMNVGPEDQKALTKALELLSLSPQPSTLGQYDTPSPISPTSPRPMDILLLPGDAGSADVPKSTVNQESILSRFSPVQQPAARAILNYMADHQMTAIPATYITEELVEISDGRGKCLIGSCATDGKLNRIDHLYDHVRDQHFEYRPYLCEFCHHAFSRDHDLEKHLQIHDAKSLECPTCAKSYTRLDDLQYHVQQMHGKVLSPQIPSPRLPVIEKPLDSPITEETTMSRSTPTITHPEKKNASTNALSPQEALTRRNSLETEMNVAPEDQEALSKALELLSPQPQPSTLGQIDRYSTLRTSTIKNLDLPESTTRTLHALVTNSFTLTQLSAARKIQKFMRENPGTPFPPFLITKEIAEIYGEYGWCLIGKCGLERISYKLTRLNSTSNVTDQELEKDQTQRRIDILCDHIRDRHFERMPFQCRLCPASYISQDGLNRHWRTHPLGDFACPTCSDIFVSDISLHQHQHSKHAKSTITSKLRRLLARAVPLK